MDGLETQLSIIVEKENALLRRVEGVAREIGRLEAELGVERSILKEYRLASYLRKSKQLAEEMEARERERLAAIEMLKEVRTQLVSGLREKRRELLGAAEGMEGEDLRQELYQIAVITLELVSLEESLEEESALRRGEIEVLPTDSPIDLREKAEIMKREAVGMEEMAATLCKKIEALKEEELTREKLIEFKERIAWLEEENVPSRGGRWLGQSRSVRPNYETGERETTARGPLSIESWEMFFGRRAVTGVAQIRQKGKELEEKRTRLLLRADSLEALADRLLRMTEEMEQLEEKQSPGRRGYAE